MDSKSAMEESLPSNRQEEGIDTGDSVSGGCFQTSDEEGLCSRSEEDRSDVDMAVVSKAWTAPDASFTKRTVKRGTGFTAPNDGAVCQVTISTVDDPAAGVHLDLGYPTGEEVEITLGNGCGIFSETVDACLETMHEGEECELNIADVKGVQCRNAEEKKSSNNVDSECGTYSSDADCAIDSVYIILHSFTRNKDIFEMSVKDILLRASELKAFGTQCFKGGRQRLAERFYIRALRYLVSVCHPKDVQDLDETEKQEYLVQRRTCSLNLAACQLKCRRYRDVIVHCGYALEGDPSNAKALYRRCQAYLALDEFENARADIQAALSGNPKNKLFLEQRRLLVKREKQVYNKLSSGMNKMFGGGS